jgi:hypothetical protein
MRVCESGMILGQPVLGKVHGWGMEMETRGRLIGHLGKRHGWMMREKLDVKTVGKLMGRQRWPKEGLYSRDQCKAKINTEGRQKLCLSLCRVCPIMWERNKSLACGVGQEFQLRAIPRAK